MIQPLAQPSQHDYAQGTHEVPYAHFDEPGPFRCARCKAYINAQFSFIEEGKKASCNICKHVTDVPGYYYC